MCERFRKITYKTDKQVINWDNLKNKTLEELIIEKDEQNNVISIRIPIFISIASIVISVILSALSSLKPQIWRQYHDIFTTVLNRLKIIFGIAYILMFVRILIVIKNILEEQNIISQNIKIYDKEIFERINKEKGKITKILKEITTNTKK